MSSETVSAAYIQGQMTRFTTAFLWVCAERTVTDTLGTLSGNGESIAPPGSQSIDEVDVFGVSIADTFDTFKPSCSFGESISSMGSLILHFVTSSMMRRLLI